jgi:hypothetical protein
MSPVTGEYKLAFRVDQQEIDEDDSNNTDTTFFYIDDQQYARDRIFASAIYLGTPDQSDVEYELGNVFHITDDNLTCHSITVGVGIGSSVPAQIQGRIYRFDIFSGVDADLLGTTELVDLNPSMFNSYGDQILTNLVFDSPIQLNAGEAYFVSVASTNGIDNFVCALSGDAEEGTSLVRYFPNDWYYLNMLPMVRMNFGLFSSVNEFNDEVIPLHVYPNPASDEVLIDLPTQMLGKAEARWYDAMGRLVRTDSPSTQSCLQYKATVSDLPSGMYQVIVSWEGLVYRASVNRR